MRSLGFDNIGLDLIYGFEGQTVKTWKNTLEKALSFQPEHLSCYELTFEKGTLFSRWQQKGIIKPLTEKELSTLFTTTTNFLQDHGYVHYEISNFAREAIYTSRHNRKYWRHVPYIGLGPSAHSFDGQARAWNVSSVSDYLALVENGELPVGGSEELSDEQLASEMVMLALRTTDGLDLNAYRQRFGRDLLGMNRAAVQDAVRRGLVTLSNSHLRPTVEGLAVADGLAAEFRC